MALTIGGWKVSAEIVVIGAFTGVTYGLLAAGLVLVYRATRVINFAYGEIGAFGAALLAKLVLDEHWNFFLAMGLVLVVGGLVGAAIELSVVRRLFRAPRTILLVATIGVSELLFVSQLLLPGIHHLQRYPSPINRTLHVGTLVLLSGHFMVIALVPAIMVGLTLFMNRTPYGMAIRAAAENPDRAELAGISTRRVSTLVWVMAGVLSTLSAILISPLRGTILGIPAPAVGPSLLLRALAAGLVGGLTSLPLALAGGVAIGVAEAILFANVANPGVVDAMLFVLVLILVLARGTRGAEDEGGWSLAPRVTSIPERLRGLWWVDRLNLLVGSGALLVAVVLPVIFTTSSKNFLFSRVLLFAIIGLSVTVLTGWAGQLSLGQFAFAGLGSMVAVALVARGMSFPMAVAYATLAGVLAASAVGFPALRARGVLLAVTTLAFAVAANNWMLSLHLFTGGKAVVVLPRSTIFGVLDLHAQRTYYYVCLAVLVACAAMVGRLRRTGIGRSIVAVRENESAAASLTLSAGVTKLTAFALAGGLAALAGALLAGSQVQFGTDAFGPEISLQLVAMVVIGGLGSVSGAILGAVYVVGLPALWNNSPTVGLLTSGVGLLVLLLYLPGGLLALVHRARDALLGLAASRQPDRPASAAATGATGRLAPPLLVGEPNRPDPTVPALVAADVSVHFGARLALDGVSIAASEGEVVGLIGSNGAGKSTLMNVISGFCSAGAGRIEVFGTDVTLLPPHRRAAYGLGRVFQDARLFGDLTVRETVKVALEPGEHSEPIPSLLGLPPSRRAEHHKSAAANDYIDFLGLGRYADSFLRDLSTGTRRIVELCCLVAQQAQLLLLDEPTAGIAQREAEAFGPLIKRIQTQLGATILLIEHDIPLVMSISDRVYCLAAGSCIAEGRPEEVRHDPKVVAAYLGTDERAIARSGAAARRRDTDVRSAEAASTNLAVLDVAKLRALAARLGVRGRSRLRKDELIAAIKRFEVVTNPAPEPIAVGPSAIPDEAGTGSSATRSARAGGSFRPAAALGGILGCTEGQAYTLVIGLILTLTITIGGMSATLH
ncbi:MAG: transporter related [Acidimicrobiales bacterium]|nr:transporter related [Acidimicrobiales bacterium]